MGLSPEHPFRKDLDAMLLKEFGILFDSYFGPYFSDRYTIGLIVLIVFSRSSADP